LKMSVNKSKRVNTFLKCYQVGLGIDKLKVMMLNSNPITILAIY